MSNSPYTHTVVTLRDVQPLYLDQKIGEVMESIPVITDAHGYVHLTDHAGRPVCGLKTEIVTFVGITQAEFDAIAEK